MEPLIDPRLAAARARAAIAYAGLDHAELEKLTGLDVAMIRRITSKANPRDGRIERLWAIADACDVPRAFMESGWLLTGAEEANEDTRTRLQNAETQLAALVSSRGRIDEVERELREVREQVADLTRERLAQRQREAAERERARRDRTPETPGAEDASAEGE